MTFLKLLFIKPNHRELRLQLTKVSGEAFREDSGR